MKTLLTVFSFFLLFLISPTLANAETFQVESTIDIEGTLDVYTNQLVYAPGDPIFVHGLATPKEPIIIRLFTPDSTIAEFEQIMTNEVEKVREENQDNICEECIKEDESVKQNLILTGYKVCNSCRISKTIFPV